MKKCDIEGCQYKTRVTFHRKSGQNLCDTHRQQLIKYGKVFERTRATRNEIINCGEFAEIILYRKNNTPHNVRAVIDAGDIERCRNHKWSLVNKPKNRTLYAFSKIDGKTIYLHQYILGTYGKGKYVQVDHIDGNGLMCSRGNLRVCTQQQNIYHQVRLRKDNKSGILGVSFDNKNKKWISQLAIKGKNVHMKYFDTKEEAAQSRRDAELFYFGEFCPNTDINKGLGVD